MKEVNYFTMILKKVCLFFKNNCLKRTPLNGSFSLRLGLILIMVGMFNI